MLLKFLIFSFAFYLIIRFISRFFVFSVHTGNSGNTQSRNNSSYNSYSHSNSNSNSNSRGNKRTKNLEQVEEAEFEDITEPAEEKSD